MPAGAVVEATLFVNNYDDLIVTVGSFTGSSRYRTDNISNARRAALEVLEPPARCWRVAGGAAARVGYTFLDTEILAVDGSASAPPPFAAAISCCAGRDITCSIDVAVAAGPLDGVPAGRGRAAAPSTSIRASVPSVASSTRRATRCGTLGASLTFWQPLEVFARVLNLFDRHYEEALGYPALGRSGMVGVRIAAGR